METTIKTQLENQYSQGITAASSVGVGIYSFKPGEPATPQANKSFRHYRLHLNRGQGQWINENIPEEGGNPTNQLTENGQLIRPTLAQAGIDKNDSPKFRTLAKIRHYTTEARLGELIKEEQEKGRLATGKENLKQHRSSNEGTSDEMKTLADYGLDKEDSYHAQALAEHQDVKIFKMALLGIPLERIADRLGMPRKTVEDHLAKTSELKKSPNEQIKRGFSPNTVAEKLGGRNRRFLTCISDAIR